MTFFEVTPETDDAVKVLDVKHWTDKLFSFSVERPTSFRFRSGEFIMLGLLDTLGKPLLRAYSVASPSWDERLSFYSIKVPDGPLTSRLQNIQVDDYIIMRKKPCGDIGIRCSDTRKTNLYDSNRHRYCTIRLSS